ncbi:MAG: glycosyltransferase family 2 protein [Bacteroidaceae bacterium]|nr:glycosyltransferase family 2 protein [Bacteroidaceae bacterium]
MQKLSVVILNWNGADMLRRYLPSVICHSQMEGVEIVVADNASQDESLTVMREEFPGIRVVRLDQNYGFAEGYNRALQQVEAEYYLLLNNDVEIRQDDWLQSMLQYMDTHTDVAACQPKIRWLVEPQKFEYSGASGGYLDCYGFPFCRGRILSALETDMGQYDTVVDVHWATGCSLLIRSKDYWAAGGLDGRFFAHMEEIDLCWRLRIMGRRLVCIPQTTVWHLGGATLAVGSPRKTYLNFRNNLLMLFKNLPEDDLKRVLCWRRPLDILAALHFLVTGDWKNFKAVFQAYRAFHRMKADFVADRQRIQQGRVKAQPDRTDYCILWRYYLRGVRRYADL